MKSEFHCGIEEVLFFTYIPYLYVTKEVMAVLDTKNQNNR